jgi:predicted PurR-regulated permease PerM
MFKRKQEELPISISNRTIVRIILFGIATYIGFRFFSNVRHSLTLIFISFFLAMALNPIVSFITRKLKSKSRVRGTAVAYLLVMAVLTTFFSLVVPPIVKQSTDFIKDVPNTITNLETQDSSVGRFVRRYNLDVQLNRIASDIGNNLGNVRGPVLTTAKSILVTIVSMITVLVLTFMMLVEGPQWVKLFIKNLPKARQKRVGILLHRMYELVTKFVNAQVIVALIAGMFALIALSIASRIYHVSINPVALAGLVAMFGIIPTIGNILAAVSVALVCLFTSAPLAITMLVYFIIYQQVENITIQPYIQSRNNDLTPMLVFIAALLGIGFGGLLGGFVAIPAAGCIKILAEDYLDDHQFNASHSNKLTESKID